jgi:hypothetical protein
MLPLGLPPKYFYVHTPPVYNPACAWELVCLWRAELAVLIRTASPQECERFSPILRESGVQHITAHCRRKAAIRVEDCPESLNGVRDVICSAKVAMNGIQMPVKAFIIEHKVLFGSRTSVAQKEM